MGISTQIRLQQLTGSVVDLKPSAISAGQVVAAAGHADLQGILEYYAQALTNIHGDLEFGNRDPGLIQHSGSNVVLRMQSEGEKILLDSAGEGAKAIDLQATDGGLFMFGHSAISGSSESTDRTAIQWHATAGGVKSIAATYNEMTAAVADNIEAIKLSASHQDGGIRLVAGNLNGVLSGSASAVRFESALGNLDLLSAQKAELRAQDSGVDAIKIDAVAGGIEIVSQDRTLVGSSAELFMTGSTAAVLRVVNGPLEMSTSGSAQLRTENGGLELKAGGDNGDAGLFMSGANGITFATDVNTANNGASNAHGGFGGNLDLAIPGEGASFVTAFAQKSILGAILDNKSAITSGEPTLFRKRIAAGTPAATVIDMSSTKVAGDVSNFEMTAGENKLEVYVNGQLLVSGSTEDYEVTAQDELTFAFDIVADDVVTVIDRS